MRGETEEAVLALQKAVALNPSFSQARHGLGMALTFAGRLDEARDSLEQVERLSPRDPILWASLVVHALADILAGDRKAAMVWARRTVQHPRAKGYWPQAVLAAALAINDDLDAARAALARAIEAKPNLTLSYLESTLPSGEPGGLAPYLDALRRVGLPNLAAPAPAIWFGYAAPLGVDVADFGPRARWATQGWGSISRPLISRVGPRRPAGRRWMGGCGGGFGIARAGSARRVALIRASALASGAPMLAFAAAVFFLIVTPGPGVLSTAGVGSGFGYRAGLGYVAGLWLGNNAVALAVVSGIATVVFTLPWLRTVLLAASAAYLLYLAAKIAFSGTRIAFLRPERPPGAWNGLALQAINPKAYAVHTTLFSGFAFLPEALWAEILIKFALMNAIWMPIHLAWLWAGVVLRRLELDPALQRAINAGMALAMLGVVGLAAAHQL